MLKQANKNEHQQIKNLNKLTNKQNLFWNKVPIAMISNKKHTHVHVF
jgi:hypothetical protein